MHLKKRKRCASCMQLKPLSSFWKRTDRKDGLDYYCRVCNYEHTRDFRTQNPWVHRRHNRNTHYRSKYGITALEFEARSHAQHDKCAICGTAAKEGKHLHVDHNHKTKKIRGLLCYLCNMGLGYFQESPVRLRAAAKYLAARK